jgi:hypothetical protein
MFTPKLREQYGRTLIFAVGSLLVFLIVETVNFNREAWLGITPGYAPHNFGFNVSFYMPSMIVSSGLAIMSVVYYIRSMRVLRRNGLRPRVLEWATVLPIGPILMLNVMVILFIIRISVEDLW